MNRLPVYRALARGVVLESLRRKDLWVVAILGFLIMLSAGALGFFGIEGLQVFVKDLSVSVLGAFGMVLAILTSSRLLPEEIKQRTLYPLLSRPISRLDLLIGKTLGAIAVSWIGFLLLAALTGFALLSFKVGFEPIMLQYVLAQLMRLVVVCSFCVMLSAYLTPAAAATMGFIFCFGCTMIVRAMNMGYAGSPPAVQGIFKGLNAILPQFQLFDLGSRAANLNWGMVPMWAMLFLVGYMAIYSAAMVSLSWLKFRRQAV